MYHYHLGMSELLIILVLVILVVVLVLFGAKKVPEMARGLGQGLKEVRNATREASSDAGESVPAGASRNASPESV